MIHIHPFPARMAPEIALTGLENLPRDYIVLDPMSGSGMVLGTAAKLGLSAFGYDLDPLACLISRVNGTGLNEDKARLACDRLLALCGRVEAEDICLDWIDADAETRDYIDFWFAPKQKGQLRALNHFLVARPFLASAKILDVLKIAVSRLIITKEPKASLARDTAHSRPHKTITKNDFDVFGALPGSLGHVLKALSPGCIKSDVKVYRGDARRMGRIRDCSIDCIVTSPPISMPLIICEVIVCLWFGGDIAYRKSGNLELDLSAQRSPTQKGITLIYIPSLQNYVQKSAIEK